VLATNWITSAFDVDVPGIIYGTAWKKERTADLVEKALLVGFRGIDTACQPKHYDEALVGVGLQRAIQKGVSRESVYLQTKFTPLSSQDPKNIPYDKSASLDEQVKQSFTTSLHNLQTDYVDCLILHSPLADHSLTMQAWQAMESLHQEGVARQLGISNCYDFSEMKSLFADAKVKPAIVQNRFYKDTGYETELREWCDEHGVIFESFWSLTANPQILDSELLQNLAVQYDKTRAQIFFRYLTQAEIVPLTGTSSEQHMQDDLNIFEFTLNPDDFMRVSSLLTAIPTLIKPITN
jgi:diketogulonate reductase-like aldo/keto reductase